MRSPFYWWCKRTWRTFKHEFKTDIQFRVAAIIVPIVLGLMAYLANNSYLLHKFL